jgi:hypothetical protein
MIWLALTAVAAGAAPSGPAMDDDRARASRLLASPALSAPAPPRAVPFDDVAASPATPVRASTPALDWSDARAALLPLFLTAALGVILSLMSWERPTPLRTRGMRRGARRSA